MHNPYVLISSYQYFIFLASIGPHQITCISHMYNISSVNEASGDSAQACKMVTPLYPYELSETNLPTVNKSFLKI